MAGATHCALETAFARTSFVTVFLHELLHDLGAFGGGLLVIGRKAEL
jgi:hypothetical protein